MLPGNFSLGLSVTISHRTLASLKDFLPMSQGIDTRNISVIGEKLWLWVGETCSKRDDILQMKRSTSGNSLVIPTLSR